jgi:hypothetical protein
VLWIIVALAAVSSGVAVATRGTGGVAANYRARVVARYASESGVTLAVATLEEDLASLGDPGARRAYLNGLGGAGGGQGEIVLGDGRVQVQIVDVGARLDANAADGRSLARLLSFLTDPIEAERVAGAIRAYVAGGVTDPGVGPSTLEAARPLRSIRELYRVPGVPPELIRRAAGFLTVDGDGTINRATASDTVLAAAAGELRDEPSRLLVVSRGWLAGHPLRHEIEAVYALAGAGLTLIRWRERDL